MPESVLVLGGGLGGLATALALLDSDRTITVVERDAAPAAIAPSDAFDDWKRPGVPQLRHTHIFLARLQMILRRHHPALLAELQQVGVMPGSLEESMPASLAENWQTAPGDEDLLHIWGRRATLEYVLRRHVERTGKVQFVHDTTLEELLVEPAGEQLRVTGARGRGPQGSQTLTADIVVDTTGVHSKSVAAFNALGANIEIERRSSRCAYYCRHFVQDSAEPEPPRRGTGATLDYLVFGVFFAENNTFSIAVTCPEFETELLDKLRRPEGFDQICQQIPALKRWYARSRPISRVLGGAGLQNRWHHFSRGKAKTVLGYFPVGDSYIQTNPIYGRGCSSAFVQAQLLREALAAQSEPRARAEHYHRSVWREMRQHFEFCLGADAAFLGRARKAHGEPTTLLERTGSHPYEAAFLPAIENSSFVAREWMKTQQMCQVTPRWVGVFVLLYVSWLWLLRSLSGARHSADPNLSGPSRAEMLRLCAALETAHSDSLEPQG